MPDQSQTKKRTVVVFSGAGLSAESGIPTFRDSNGLWESHRVEDIFGDGGYTCDFKAHQDVPVKLGDLCPKCGGQLRPDVVWFGEAVRHEVADHAVLHAFFVALGQIFEDGLTNGLHHLAAILRQLGEILFDRRGLALQGASHQ